MTNPFLLALLAINLAASHHADTRDYAKSWDQIRSAISRGYYARDTRRDEMEKLLDKYGAIASAAKNDQQFDGAVRAMIAAFGDSHFDYLTKDEQGFYLMDGLSRGEKAAQMPEIGAWFKSGPNGYTVGMVLNDSQAERAGLRVGDLVKSVDGVPFSPIQALAPLVDKQATFEVQRGDQTLSLKMSVQSERAMEMFLDATRSSTKIIEKNGRKIGYFHLWTLANTEFQSSLANAVYGKLSRTDAFILDLRDGFGGRPEGYADPFFRPEVKLDWKFPQYTNHELFGYQRPLVVLINGGSRSAKEVLSFILKKSKRAKLLGATTAGNVLGTFPQRMDEDSYLEIPIVDVAADGQRLEGVGVTPDVRIVPEYDRDGKDRVLEAAIRDLENVKTETGKLPNAAQD